MAKIKTSEKILQCATELFASQGFDAVSMDELARHCDVNKASIYYHYKDKAALYEAAISGLISLTADALEEAVTKESSYPEKLRAFIATFARYAYEHPTFPAALMRELAAGGHTVPRAVRDQMLRILSLLKSILKGGEEADAFRKSDHMVVHFMIIGTINFYVLSRPLREIIEVEDPDVQATVRHNDIAEVSDEIARILCQSIKYEEN